MRIKSILWQGGLLGVVILIIVAGINRKLVQSLFESAGKTDDFGYRDSVFVVYRGPFQDAPWLAAVFWSAVIIIASIIALTILKMLWFALRQRSLSSNR
ncbi:hypothetical protein [Paenibacillus glycanilyticus]|uniref:hypothetical protein n=1 Tax=Paenibacillus glycanilyticus TaxID=126569 RepID=UPI003EB865A5